MAPPSDPFHDKPTGPEGSGLRNTCAAPEASTAPGSDRLAKVGRAVLSVLALIFCLGVIRVMSKTTKDRD